MAFTVDIHHHILPDFFWQATNEADNPVGGIAPPPWSVEAALSFIDDAGIDVAVTSISTPGVHTEGRKPPRLDLRARHETTWNKSCATTCMFTRELRQVVSWRDLRLESS